MFHHRSSKQVQKPFRGKSKSKLKKHGRSLVRDRAGSRPTIGSLGRDGEGREKRVNQARQLRENKRAELLARKRSRAGPPRIVALVSLGESVDLRKVRTTLLKFCGLQNSESTEGHITLQTRIGKPNLKITFWEAPRTLEAILDIAKVSDIILFVTSPPNTEEQTKLNSDIGVDDFGRIMISALKTQGLPASIGLIQGLQNFPRKQQTLLAKNCNRFFHETIHEKMKVLQIDSNEDCKQIFRFLESEPIKDISWRDRRSYLFAEDIQFSPNSDEKNGTLEVRGYLRGNRHLNPNRLIHITGFNDYQISHIDLYLSKNDESSRKQSLSSSLSIQTSDLENIDMKQSLFCEQKQMDEDVIYNTVHSDEKRETLQSLTDFDWTMNEQSLITDEEIKEAEIERAKLVLKDAHARELDSKGISIYQDSWTEALGWDKNDVELEKPQKDLFDTNKLSETENSIDGGKSECEMDVTPSDFEYQPTIEKEDSAEREVLLRGLLNIDSKLAITEEDLKKLKLKLARDEMDFPDEVDTPLDQPARQRFARYRGLKSFRNSHWNPHEQLPAPYSRIAQFENFYEAQKIAEDESSKGIISGIRVVIHLLNVPKDEAQSMRDRHLNGQFPIILSGLWEHEHRISVLHFQIKRDPSYIGPIKAKESMIFHCGFRRFQARPIYSQSDPGCDKQMTDRFFQAGRFACASIFGQVMYGPCPVLLTYPSDLVDISKNDDKLGASNVNENLNAPKLVAQGKFLSVDTDRLLIKRILLTGYSIRCHKRKAVVRYMFFRPLDIRWFMKVELKTKHGLIGHIDEPLGTHGYMKCSFSGSIKGDDIVCLALYKRQFPPFPLNEFMKINK